MTTQLATKTKATQLLFSALENSGLAYAVLRNHEQYPDFGHDIDLVIGESDLPTWREMLQTLAREHGWFGVWECTHRTRSHCAHHRIQIFRIYLTHPEESQLEFLQVDIFHGFLLWALPLVNEGELLSAREWDSRGFYKLNSNLENLFRMQQIHSLYRINAHEKIARYREKVLTHAATNTNNFTESLSQYWGHLGKEALSHLRENDQPAYSATINQMKRYFFWKALKSNPVKVGMQFFHRLRDYFYFYCTAPCGSIISIEQPASKDSPSSTPKALDTLQDAHVISNWMDKKNSSWLSQIRCKERGGLVIRWKKPPVQAELPCSHAPETYPMLRDLILKVESRHHLLYSQEQPQ